MFIHDTLLTKFSSSIEDFLLNFNNFLHTDANSWYNRVMGRILLLFLLFAFTTPCWAIQRGGIQYTPSIDYSGIETSRLEQEAFSDYNVAISSTIPEEINASTIRALGAYRTLLSKHPENVSYCLRIAELYDKSKKNRLAKEFYYRAITLNSSSPLPYEGFGDYYYRRADYKRALVQFNEAYIRDNQIYNVSNKIGTIYQKFGDTRSALKYLKEAYNLNPNEELAGKIRLLEELNSTNKVYYQNTRIHFVED